MYRKADDGNEVIRSNPRRLMSSSTLLRKQRTQSPTPRSKKPTRAQRAASPSASFASNTDTESDCACYSYPTSGRTRPRTTTNACRQPAVAAGGTKAAASRRRRDAENCAGNRGNNESEDDSPSASSADGGRFSLGDGVVHCTRRVGALRTAASGAVHRGGVNSRTVMPYNSTDGQQYCYSCAGAIAADTDGCSSSTSGSGGRSHKTISILFSIKREIFMMTVIGVVTSLAIVSQMVAMGCEQSARLLRDADAFGNVHPHVHPPLHYAVHPHSHAAADDFGNAPLLNAHAAAAAMQGPVTCINFPFKSILNSQFVLKRVPCLLEMSEVTYGLLRPHPHLAATFLIFAIIFAVAERIAICYAALRFAYGIVCRRVLRPLFRVVVTLSVVKFSFLSSKMFFSMMLSGKVGDKAWLSPSLAQSIVECLELGELPIDAMIGTVAALSSRAARSVLGLVQVWLFTS